jgi:hypothetical protein
VTDQNEFIVVMSPNGANGFTYVEGKISCRSRHVAESGEG